VDDAGPSLWAIDVATAGFAAAAAVAAAAAARAPTARARAARAAAEGGVRGVGGGTRGVAVFLIWRPGRGPRGGCFVPNSVAASGAATGNGEVTIDGDVIDLEDSTSEEDTDGAGGGGHGGVTAAQ
jgi:hypothetical protein